MAYITILEDLLLAFRVPVFSKKSKRALIKHSKFYYFDAGVFRSLRPCGPLDRPEEIEGAALEELRRAKANKLLGVRQGPARIEAGVRQVPQRFLEAAKIISEERQTDGGA